MININSSGKIELAKGVVVYTPLNSPMPYETEYCFTIEEFESKKRMLSGLKISYIAKELNFTDKSWIEGKEANSYKEALNIYNMTEDEYDKKMQLKPENTLSEILKEVTNLQLEVMALKMGGNGIDMPIIPEIPSASPTEEDIETPNEEIPLTYEEDTEVGDKQDNDSLLTENSESNDSI